MCVCEESLHSNKCNVSDSLKPHSSLIDHSNGGTGEGQKYKKASITKQA